MHNASIRQHVNGAQAEIVVNTTAEREIRQEAFDIENFVTDGNVLLDAVIDEVDDMTNVPAHLEKAVARISCFSTCIKRHLALISEAGERIVGITQAVPQ